MTDSNADAGKIWLRDYPPDVPAEIDPDSIPSLKQLYEDACRKHASKSAFSNMGARLTYAWKQAVLEKRFCIVLGSLVIELELDLEPAGGHICRVAPGRAQIVVLEIVGRLKYRDHSRHLIKKPESVVGETVLKQAVDDLADPRRKITSVQSFKQRASELH
jgi:hypothetical protein